MTGRRQLLAHRDKSQSPEFTVGIDAKRTFVDKRSRPNLQRMTQGGHRTCKMPHYVLSFY